jgi:hypothetical protein
MRVHRRVPDGLIPRLLSKTAAAYYCGMSWARFQRSVGQNVEPVEIEDGGEPLFDRKDLDLWVDRRSPHAHAVVDERSIAERLNGRDEDTRR